MNKKQNSTSYNQEAEQSVLGSIILDVSCLNNVIEILPNSNFFYDPINKLIYSTILDMFSSGERIDFVTVLNKITEVDNTRKNDIKNYMLDLTKIVPSISGVIEYAKIIKDKFELRSLILLSNQIISESSKSENANKLLEFAEQKISEIRSGKITQSLASAKDILLKRFECLDKINSKSVNDILGIPTGFQKLDFATSGLNPGDLILLAARPGMGKTSFALSIAKNTSNEFKTAIFSLEMSSEQLISRLLSMEGKIPSNRLRNGHLDADEWVRASKACEVISKSQLYIDDTACITVQEMKAKLRRLTDVKLVIIDYLQLISSGRRVENRVQEISEITRQLKIMAKELYVPVLCLSQLSRASEQREDHRPRLSDLRDSGSIEQDADIVLMLYRHGYYHPSDEKVDQNKCECIISKNRHGELRTFEVNWNPSFVSFESD